MLIIFLLLKMNFIYFHVQYRVRFLAKVSHTCLIYIPSDRFKQKTTK